MSSERELDEGIRSIKSAWRREHTARANLEKMLEQADAENAKLRNGYGSMSREHSQTIVELSDAYYSIDQLNAENAKLRELCRDLYECASDSAYSCPNTCKHWNENEYCCSLNLSDRMSELGVEVSE